MHTSKNGISNEMLQNLHKLAYSHRTIEFKEIFNSLSHHNKQCYYKIIITEGRASSMFCVLNVIGEDQAVSIFYGLLKKNKEFAFRTLDVTIPKFTLFKTLFNRLSQYQEKYINHVIEKKKSFSTMSYILSAMTKDQAASTFYDLLKKDQGFAFNTLDAIFYQSTTLLNTLFSQLNPQQKEDYRIHLGMKLTFGAQSILKNFYSNNKDNSNKLKIESLNNGSLVQKRVGLDEFSSLNPASFSPRSVTLEKEVDKCELDSRNLIPAEFTFVEEIHIKPAEKRQRTSANSFPDYSKKTAYSFSSIVKGEKESSTVSSSLTSNKNISNSLEGELILHDISSELADQPCDELISLVNEEQPSSSLQLSIFDRLGDLEEIHLKQPTKLQYVLPQ